MNQHLVNELNLLKKRVTELEAGRVTHMGFLNDLVEGQTASLKNIELLHGRCSQLEDAVKTLLEMVNKHD